MDSFKVSTVGGKLKLVFDGHTYGYSNPIGNSGCHWTCVLKPCSAHVNTNKTKTKIIGGDYVHTHDKDPSKRNSTTREKNSPSTVKTKPSTDMSGQPGPATPKGPPPAAPAPNPAPSTDISGQSRPATPSGPPAPDPAPTTPPYYPPPPPPFPDHYDYGFPPFPPHPYDYDYGYYYDVEPYSYPYEDQGTSRGMTRNVRDTPNMGFF
ncbi:hypothetical protein M8J76_009937 [Diaphorina citri]|nr:hypothetical protein M8J76_009937 [Diaphorina citri]